MQRIEVEIIGTKPLLQNKMSIKTQAGLVEKSKKRQGAFSEEDPKEKLYLVDGHICQPAEHIYRALVKRAGNYKITGRGKKSYKELVIGAVQVSPDMIVHHIQDYVIDERTVIIQATKGRVVTRRPKLMEWSLTFNIDIINDDLPHEVVKEMLDEVGREGGIGDYRPRFGTFIVTKWKLL